MNIKSILLWFIIIQQFAFIAIGQTNQDALIANEYYSQGEYDKALALYEKMEENYSLIPLIHKNYLELLQLKQLNEKAKKYLEKIRVLAPSNVMYAVDEIDHFIVINDSIKSQSHFESLKNEVHKNPNLLRASAQYLINKQHYAYAEELYLSFRKMLKVPNAYAIQLATLYRYTNQKSRMIEEYVKYAEEAPGRIRYVKSILQMTLKEEEDISNLIQEMLKNIQRDPSNDIYSELLIWANLQNDNYYGAFIQSKALDKRTNSQGENTFEIGNLALENQDFASAIDIFQFLVDNYRQSTLFLPSKENLILAKKKRIEKQFPIDTAAVRNLVKDYENFITEQGLNQYTLSAYREKALLQAFYLNQQEEAIVILNKIIENSASQRNLIAQAKIDLADIYLIIDQPWESTLLYSQVEKAYKNEPIGELAKLKNAKASFYRGNFKLAQEHLDILKKTTRREISNNAIDLSILIKNNTILDSTQAALTAYAEIDLLLYQNKLQLAEDKITEIITLYTDHPILDELYWLNAQIKIQKGEYEAAVKILEEIVENLPYDILTDDALFERANLTENFLNDKEAAASLYQQLLVEFPGSIYVAEARKRFRSLRGDFVN